MYELLYRVLYWQQYELQIIGNEYTMQRADRIEKALCFLQSKLGYMPSC
jgi:hypothetical protein